MDPRLRSQRLWQLFEQFPRKSLYRIGRAARASVADGTRKHDVIETLCALPEAVLEQALVEGLARQDLQALCKRLGYASTGSNADLAARLLAAVDDPALRAPRWRPFTEARAFAQRLGLASRAEWYAFGGGHLPDKGALPADVPVAPDARYANAGWTSWGDFLGTGYVAPRLRTYRPFQQARAYARSLGLASRAEWSAFVRGHLPNKGVLPADIPALPPQTYAKAGWTNWGDFLGTGYVAQRLRTYRPFQQARAYARSLGLTSRTEWLAFVRGDLPDKGTPPADIPRHPHLCYVKAGWTSWGDFLGTGRVANQKRVFRPFRQARVYARSLGLASSAEWSAFVHGDLPDKGTLPADIPTQPGQAYARAGWTSWGDFLGTGNVARHIMTYRPFQQARAYARSLGLGSRAEWQVFCRARSGKRRALPPDIPAAPHLVYADHGWLGYGDWLDTGRVPLSKDQYRSYEEACTFVRALGIRSQAEWRTYCRGELGGLGPRPLDIPGAPSQVYSGLGWVSWGHFLGTNTVASARRTFRSFAAARAYVRKQGLRSNTEWRAWCAAGNRPADIPAAPDAVFRGRGWVSWRDFLGTDNIAPSRVRRRSFAAMRAFVRRLGLSAASEYRQAKRDGRIPKDIPLMIERHPEWKGWTDFLGPSYAGSRRPVTHQARKRGRRG
jgi:hypothetical protein